LAYTPDDDSADPGVPYTHGSNMDVFVNGQLLMADTGAFGTNADRDYGETTTTGITFRFRVEAPATVIYIIRE